MIAKISRPLALLSALGWVLTLVLSLASLAGLLLPMWTLDTFFFVLFPLFAGGTILLHWHNDGRILTGSLIWKEAIDNSPTWMRRAAFGTVFYALGLFAIQFFDFQVPDMSLALAGISQFFAFALLMLWTTSQSSPVSKSSSLKES